MKMKLAGKINVMLIRIFKHVEGSTILLASRIMLGECCLAAIQPKGFWTRLSAQERESVCVCVRERERERGRIRMYHSRQ
jgi:hypothetical protein